MTLALWIACAPSPAPDAPNAGTTWADALSADPSRFAELTGSADREGWIALHAGRPVDAMERFESVDGKARAALDLARTHRGLGRVHRASAIALAEEWSRRAEVPAPILEAAALARDCGPAPPDALTRDVVLAKVEEPGFTRVVYHPCVDTWRAEVWERQARAAESLAPWFGPDAALAPTPSRGSQAARDDAAALRAAIDAGRSRAAAHPEAGRALRAELRLDERLAVETALLAAEIALDEGSATYARDLLTGMETPSAHGVSPVNPPALYAWLAAGELESGRSREALDRLARLDGPGVPNATGPRETLADLCALRGLNADGLAREP